MTSESNCFFVLEVISLLSELTPWGHGRFSKQRRRRLKYNSGIFDANAEQVSSARDRSRCRSVACGEFCGFPFPTRVKLFDEGEVLSMLLQRCGSFSEGGLAPRGMSGSSPRWRCAYVCPVFFCNLLVPFILGRRFHVSVVVIGRRAAIS